MKTSVFKYHRAELPQDRHCLLVASRDDWCAAGVKQQLATAPGRRFMSEVTRTSETLQHSYSRFPSRRDFTHIEDTTFIQHGY